MNQVRAMPLRRRNLAILFSPFFGPKACLVITEADAYNLCQIQVPDIAKPLSAISYRGQYFSIFKQEGDAGRLIEIATKLTRRGDDILIAMAPPSYILALLEPNGKPV